MLTIRKSYVEEKDGMATLITEVDEDGTAKRLSATVEKEYAEYLCYERADAALIGLLSYALRHKHDIVCEAPVTDELLYNINEVLFPALMKNDSDNYHVKIQCDTAECIEKCSHAGGGRNRPILRGGQLSRGGKAL